VVETEDEMREIMEELRRLRQKHEEDTAELKAMILGRAGSEKREAAA
jgi:hypothetical protein